MIRLPDYLLGDEELFMLAARLEEFAKGTVCDPCTKAHDALVDIERVLRGRRKPVTLEGDRFGHPKVLRLVSDRGDR